MNQVTCPSVTLEQIFRILIETPNQPVYARAGICNAEERMEWLIGRPQFSVPASYGLPSNPLVNFHLGPLPQEASLNQPPDTAQIYLEGTDDRVLLQGRLCLGQSVITMESFSVVGPGLLHLESTGITEMQTDGLHLVHPSRSLTDMKNAERWSRTIGALGSPDAWHRLNRLSIGVIGCGRTGSLMAQGLARLGIGRLVLVDPDVVEMHNLGEMAMVTDDDARKRRPKVIAIAGNIRAMSEISPQSIVPIALPVTASRALTTLRTCDVLICCADSDAARLAAAMLATMYHRVLIDIGTGIRFSNRGTQRQMGSDIRLILPEDGCLLCRGGLVDREGALKALRSGHALTLLAEPLHDWHTQRAGSLYSLNQLATGLSMQLLQDLATSRLRQSTWVRITVNDEGHVNTQYQQLSPTPNCPLCAYAGIGDAGLGLE